MYVMHTMYTMALRQRAHQVPVGKTPVSRFTHTYIHTYMCLEVKEVEKIGPQGAGEMSTEEWRRERGRERERGRVSE
jgi:hypothetical protein